MALKQFATPRNGVDAVYNKQSSVFSRAIENRKRELGSENYNAGVAKNRLLQGILIQSFRTNSGSGIKIVNGKLAAGKVA